MNPNKRIPVWERVKRKKRRDRLIRLILIVLLLFAAVNLAIRVPALIKDFNQPFERLPGDKGFTRKLDLSFRSNFLLTSFNEKNKLSDLAVVSYEPVDEKITILHLDFENNFALQRAARGILKDNGIKGLTKYVSIGLAIPIDRYFSVNNSMITNQNLLNVKREIESLSAFLKTFSIKGTLEKNGFKTNASMKEIVDLFWKIRSSSFDENDLTSLEKIKSLSSNEALSLTENLFLDRKILDEAASVAVLNSSGEIGLEGVLVNYLTNIGVSVVEIGSSDEVVEKSFLVKNKERPAIEERLKTIFGFKEEKDGIEFSGDVLIVIGKDSVGDLTLK